MRRAALALFLLTVLAGLATVAAAAASDERALAFTLGVARSDRAVTAGDQAPLCQGPIDVPSAFDALELKPETPEEGLGAPISVVLREAPGGALIQSLRVPGGYPDGTVRTVRVARVPAGQRISVCARRLTPGELTLYGDTGLASRSTVLTVDGDEKDRDASLVFLRDRPHTVLSLAPVMAERAALFLPGWVGARGLLALGGLALVAAVLLTAGALAVAARGRASPPATGSLHRPPRPRDEETNA